MVMQSLRDGASGGFFKYILLVILGLAAGGLIFTDVSGVFTGGTGIGGNDVIKTQTQTMNINEFNNELHLSANRFKITVEQAKKIGLIQQLLTEFTRNTLIQEDAHQIGLEVGKKSMVQRELKRQRTVARYAKKRGELKAIIKNVN